MASYPFSQHHPVIPHSGSHNHFWAWSFPHTTPERFPLFLKKHYLPSRSSLTHSTHPWGPCLTGHINKIYIIYIVSACLPSTTGHSFIVSLVLARGDCHFHFVRQEMDTTAGSAPGPGSQWWSEVAEVLPLSVCGEKLSILPLFPLFSLA